MPERILIGVAWPYANGPLHLGHIAGAYLPADVFARYHRMRGNDVLMVSGSDSHGAPITMRADVEGVPPREVVERYHASFLESWERLGITFDLFTTTMTDNHRKVTHDLWRSLQQRGYIYESSMKVAYSPDYDRFLPDRYVRGVCPKCQFEDARGDQCDNCGSILDPVDLGNPAYNVDGERHPVEIRDTEHQFLRLSAFRDQLAAWVEEQRHWRPNVRNFTLGFLREGLKDRAITRNLDWGLPVPVEGYEDRRIYVWFEAVIGYLSASVEWAARNGQPEAWRPYWEDPATRAYYFVGKDNIPFHTIIWPAMLLGQAAYILPYDVPANEFLNLEGRQLSTSRNWAVWVPDYLDRFPPDPLRYHLAANLPETSDADFTWSEYVRRNNDELVATFGNLVHRVLTQVYRNFDKCVPDPGDLGVADKELIGKAEAAMGAVAESLEAVRLREALNTSMGLAREANRYLDAQAPWQQVKSDKTAAGRTLYTAMQALMALRVTLHPFLPFSTQRLHELLGRAGRVQDVGWHLEASEPGAPLPEPTPLFAKLDDSVAAEMLAKLG
ncbi:MAG: methionine--tRNA ligase [Chloroflexota bacterium]|nr:methionine--tRNA ligase [Chloroflexota bacterium]MDE2885495.1 methionine--tRNA ligase [Chloroflexota bacterium]